MCTDTILDLVFKSPYVFFLFFLTFNFLVFLLVYIIIFIVYISSVGSLQGGLSILVALGFREAENGSLLLTIDSNLKALDARRLELEVGLDLLRNRVGCIEEERDASEG